MTIPEPDELLRHQLRRVFVELSDGASTLLRTPRAIGPITAISIDSMGQGIILTVAAVVFREQFKEGVGSYSNLVGAGGVGVLVGIVTVGWLEQRWSKERIIAGAFVVGGFACSAPRCTSGAGRSWSRASWSVSPSRGRRCPSTRSCRDPSPTGIAGASSRSTTSSTTSLASSPRPS
jgi:hypothetical protein